MATNKRVQVADLADAPRLQATIQSGGNYNVAVQQAGDNKMLQLARSLEKVNPMLRDYAAIKKIEGDEQRAKGEQFFAEDSTKALASLEARRNKTKQQLRSLAEKGVIDERSNPDFLLGIKAASSKSQAKEFRRKLLTNPEALQSDDPVGYAQEAVKGFYDSIDSAYARESVKPLLDSISNEFISTVTRREQDLAIAQGKTDWLGSISDEVSAWTRNQFDINDPVFKEWIDDGAGSFKGSRKYALDNLFKPAITDMVEQGNTAGAMKKVMELKKWKINDKGAKFANTEILNSLDELERSILSNGQYFTNLAITSYNTNKTNVSEPFEAEFQQRLNNDEPITDAFLNDWSTRVRTSFTENSVKSSDAERLIAQMREEANKAYNRESEANTVTNPDVYAEIRKQLELGLDVSDNLESYKDELSLTDYKELLKANGNETDFQKNVMSRFAVRDYTDIIETEFSNTTIKGGIPIPGKVNDSNYVKNLLGLPSDVRTPPQALQVLSADIKSIWSNELRRYRDRISQFPNITPDELYKKIDEGVGDVYSSLELKIEERVKERLKTGNFNIGLTSTDFENYNSGKDLKTIPNILTKMGFDEKDEKGRLAFIKTYINKQL
jgi:hypothetical protein